MRRRNLIGLFFILLAILVGLSTLNIFPSGIIFVTLSTIILGYFIVRSLLKYDFFVPIWLLGLLFYIYNNEFHFLPISGGKIFIITLLLGIGIPMLIPKKRKYASYRKILTGTSFSNTTFGEVTRYININETSYFSSKITCGETNIYFEKLETYPLKDVELNISATLGEVKIFVPKEWHINNKVTTILGEVNIPRSTNNNRDVNIILTGTLTFGEITVIYI